MSRIRSRLTFSNVTAMVAVFVALGGGAYAAQKVGPRDIAKNAVRSKHVKNKAVKSRHVNNRAVKAAKIANGAVGAAKLAPNAVAARAYAYVETNGEVRPEVPSHGITSENIDHPSAGLYCISGLPFTPRHAQVSASSVGQRRHAAVAAGIDDGNCDGEEQVAVHTEALTTGNPADDQFSIMLW